MVTIIQGLTQLRADKGLGIPVETGLLQHLSRGKGCKAPSTTCTHGLTESDMVITSVTPAGGTQPALTTGEVMVVACSGGKISGSPHVKKKTGCSCFGTSLGDSYFIITSKTVTSYRKYYLTKILPFCTLK